MLIIDSGLSGERRVWFYLLSAEFAKAVIIRKKCSRSDCHLVVKPKLGLLY